MRSAVVAGSIGKENLGDEALLASFVRRHRPDYARLTVLTHQPIDHGPSEYAMLEPPHLATGWRFWRGAGERYRARRILLSSSAGTSIDYVWLGGLLGHIVPHLRARLTELDWARSFATRLVYYFGDASDGFADTQLTRRVVTSLDRFDTWIAVRSAEAEEVLRHAGWRAEVHVGLDSVLYDRAEDWGLPFPRRREPTSALAIIPCNFRTDVLRPAWLDAASVAMRRGLTVRWISVSDPDDLALCRDLRATLQQTDPACHQELYSGRDAEQGLIDAAACVATRYHGMIFSLTHGVPTLPVPYDSKVRRLARQLGLADWTVDPLDVPELSSAGLMHELLHAALDNQWSLDYTALERAIASHRAALNSFSAFLGT